MFNILAAMDLIDGARVVDLFAGSGALGIEALSRGAAQVTFVDSDRDAVEIIRANLCALGWSGPDVGPSIRVECGDAGRFRRLGDTDLLLADPPYAFSGWSGLLSGFLDAGFGGVAVLESGTEVDHGLRWNALKVRRYGSTVVQFVQPAVMAGSPAEPKGAR
jgi:16S rRNA (guanine966-N2)-methyltransferase